MDIKHPYPSPFWDQRYAEPGFVYGREPNRFLASQLAALSPGHLLLPGEGEGRNAIWAARQGWQVTAFDQSPVAQAKALDWAREEGLTIRYDVDDVRTFDLQAAAPTHIGLIYCHLPVPLRQDFHRRIVQALPPGGMVVLEAFHPRQILNGMTSGGPKELDMLMSRETLEAEFAGLDIVYLAEAVQYLSEGAFHSGRAETVSMLARKPL